MYLLQAHSDPTTTSSYESKGDADLWHSITGRYAALKEIVYELEDVGPVFYIFESALLYPLALLSSYVCNPDHDSFSIHPSLSPPGAIPYYVPASYWPEINIANELNSNPQENNALAYKAAKLKRAAEMRKEER